MPGFGKPRQEADAGLTLDDIHGILHAPTVADWKAIAGQRLTALEAKLAELQQARDVLAAALLCRYDHPATDCMIMGAEIDRRLDEIGPKPRSHA